MKKKTDYLLLAAGVIFLIMFCVSGVKLWQYYNDTKEQKEVQAGGSGPVCSALVVYSDIIKKLEKKELKRVLYVATGALFNPSMVFQKENILSIAHAVSLESVE